MKIIKKHYNTKLQKVSLILVINISSLVTFFLVSISLYLSDTKFVYTNSLK